MDIHTTLKTALEQAGLALHAHAHNATDEIVYRLLGEVVPNGTCEWFVGHAWRETNAGYIIRAIAVAATRSAWAGGLIDGTVGEPDSHVIKSVQAVLRQAR